MTCDIVSCADCMNYGLHKGHVHELVTAVADGHRSQLQEHVRAAEAADVEAAEAARAAEQVIHQIGAEPSPVTSGTRTSAKQKITEAFRSFREALDAREQELMTKVESVADEKLAAARKQLNELGMHRSTLHVAREVAEQTLAMAPWEFSARYKRCIEILQTAARAEIPDAVDAVIPVSLATDEVLSTIASFGSVGGPEAPLEAHCELQGSTAVVTWQHPASSALPVLAYVVQRAVGEAGRYAPTGRTNEARLEQRVDDLAGQSLRYRVRAEDEGGNVGAWVQSPAVQLPETFWIELRFQSPFDENGVLHHIGTAGGQREYQNPHNTGDVVASMSSFGHSSCSPAHFVQHTHAEPVYNFTSNQVSSWMSVDLLNRRLVPSHYALRSDKYNCHRLHNWELQASNDGQDWTTLCVHVDDQSLSYQPMSVAAWPIDAGTIPGRSFRHFRILQTGKNSDGYDLLTCAGIELNGLLLDGQVHVLG